jgi:flotillin
MSSPRKKQRAAAAEVFAKQNVMNVDEADSFGATANDAVDNDVPQESTRQINPLNSSLAGSKPSSPRPRKRQAPANLPSINAFKTSEELQLEVESIQVRETGILFWKRIIVPPNAYVVHTRAGHTEPKTLGLGLSFSYNPRTDAYLVVPAAMQTIGVVSNCISQEKQGINVLAYVQWQISDFSVAYRKLDFSDASDPLGIVNAQLREQADAAIKDKIATMSVEEVLTDKAPIIEELTRRLIGVAEGRVRGAESVELGLGITIVTVQIKEALVSSMNLWENLQAPYRHEQARIAKISYLDMEEEIRTKQLKTRQATETSEAETQVQIERVREEKRTEALQLRLNEDEKRKQREQESNAIQIQREQEMKLTEARLEAETQAQLDEMEREQEIQMLEAERALVEQKAQIEQQRLTHEAALQRAQFEHEQFIQQQDNILKIEALEAELTLQLQTEQAEAEREAITQQTQHRQAELGVEIKRLQQEVRNLVSDEALLQEWIHRLPQLAESMPDVQEMRVLQMGEGDQHLATFLAQQESIFSTLRQFLGRDKPSQPVD